MKSADDTRLLQYNYTHLYTHHTGQLYLHILHFYEWYVELEAHQPTFFSAKVTPVSFLKHIAWQMYRYNSDPPKWERSWLLKEMGDDTLIGLLHYAQNTPMINEGN